MKGQGIVEYALILVLILVIVIIMAAIIFGDSNETSSVTLKPNCDQENHIGYWTRYQKVGKDRNGFEVKEWVYARDMTETEYGQNCNEAGK